MTVSEPESGDAPSTAPMDGERRFSRWLRDQMREQGLRGVDVARASNGLIGQSQVSRWLNGRSRPSLDSGAAIASALGLPPADVVEAISADRPAADLRRPAQQRAAMAVPVGFDGSRWHREVDGDRMVAKRLADLLDPGERPALDLRGSDSSTAEASARYREAIQQMEVAMRERSAALRSLLQAGMAVQDLASLLGVAPRGLEQRIRASDRRADESGWLG